MQIIILLLLSFIASLTVVWGTQLFHLSKRSARVNLILILTGVFVCMVFSVLAEVVILGERPRFYYHTHRPGPAALKIFLLSCAAGGLYYALALMTFERKKLRGGVLTRLVQSFLWGFCGALLLEIGYFNFRHFELMGSGAPEIIFASDQTHGRGFYFNRASWKFHPYYYGTSERQLVTYVNYKKIRNITYAFDDGTPRTKIHFGYDDQSHSNYEWIRDHEFIQGIPRSFSIPLHTVGTTYSVTLGLPDEDGVQDRGAYGISLDHVTINQTVPLMIDPVRFGLCFLLIFLITAFLPGSPLWSLPFSFRSVPQMGGVLLLMGFCAAFFVWTSFSSYTGSEQSISEQKEVLTQNDQQYYMLVDALLARRYALLETPHRYLEQLDDPYDMAQREGKNFGYEWDTAYYNGNYYVYFGVVPAVMILLPYKLITGQDLPLDLPILGFCCLFIVGLYGIYSQIVKRCFPKINFGLYFMGLLLLLTSLNLTWCLRRPLVYEMAITSGICFAVWGIFFMLLAMNGGSVQYICILFSGACTGLAVGCRPTMLFVSLVVFTLGWFLLRKDGALFSWKNVIRTFLFLLPYIAVGLALMKYNYERFDNPFEFGITYQLTTENRAVGIPLLGFYGRLLSVISSLFTLPVVNMDFPFIHLQKPVLAYNGVILNGDMVLGLFAYPLMWFLAMFPAARKRLRQHGNFLFPFCLACLAAALGICVTASAFSIANRYLTDYLYLAGLCAVFVLFCVYEKCTELNWMTPVRAGVLLCGIAGIFLFITLSLTGEGNWFRMINPLYYDRIRYAFSPWL